MDDYDDKVYTEEVAIKQINKIIMIGKKKRI